MAQKTSFVSPGTYSIETDLSKIPQAAAQIGAAVVGLTEKGPAFFPTPVVGTFSNFRSRFGNLNKEMYLPYLVREYLQYAPLINVVKVLGKGDPTNGYAVNCGRAFVLAFPATGGVSLSSSTATYTNNLSAVETLAVLRTRLDNSGNDVITNITYTGTPSSFSATIGSTIINGLSLDNTQSNYIEKILGTDPETYHFGDSATGVYVDAVLNYRFASLTGSVTGSTFGSVANPASGSATGLRYITGGYKTAETPVFVSQPFVSGTSVTNYQLFKLVSKTDGEASNLDIKISIQDIEIQNPTTPKVTPKFTIQIRNYGDTDSRPEVVESFRVNLDPESDFYISRVIGDMYKTITITNPGDAPVVVENGEFVNKSNFVRVVMYPGYSTDARPMGFLGPKSINPYVATVGGIVQYENDIPLKTDHLSDNGFKSNSVFPGFDFEGSNAIGFADRLKGTFCAVDGTTGSRGFLLIGSTAESTTYVPSLSSAYNASLTSQFTIMDVTITGSSSIIQNELQFTAPMLGGFDGIPPSKNLLKAINDGTLSSEFISAVNSLANPRELDINLIFVPGVHNGASTYNGQIPSRVIEICENRGDCFYVMDIGQALDPTATNITTDARSCSITDAINGLAGYDSSYAGAFYNWAQIYDADINRSIWVPNSVLIANNLAYTDAVKFPWYAPAGFNRGNLKDSLRLNRHLTQQNSDDLYLGRVNPLVTFVNHGQFIFGQKTLLKDDTSLNRINVRRLMIYIKKVLASLANQVLFEQNTPKQRQALINVMTPILDKVVLRQGIDRYKLIIDDTNNTPDTIDRNELRATLMLVPTKSIEVIIMNFVLMNHGATFTEIAQQLNN